MGLEALAGVKTVAEIAREYQVHPAQISSGQVDPRPDNMLLVTTDGRKAALDLRLHDPRLPDRLDSKLNPAINNIECI